MLLAYVDVLLKQKAGQMVHDAVCRSAVQHVLAQL